ncbi:MAG: hypothetical protein LC732_00910 [Acidobacteria bacterium]|nr:hypothetical protein [Acidobacteriota bacterium]
MQTIEFPGLANHMRNLPAAGTGRDRQLHRLIDLYASAEAAAALRYAAAHPREQAGVLTTALKEAEIVLRGGLADCGLSMEDEAHDRFRDAATSPEFLALLPAWIRELREIASSRPETGACNLATALELWSWTMNHFRSGEGARAEWSGRAIDETAEALCPLLGARYLVLEIAGESSPAATEAEFRADLCRVHAARASASVAAACAELVFGYRRHLGWDPEECGTCYSGDDLDDLEALMPGIASGARMGSDVIEADGTHPAKAGPCARFDGVDRFMQLRNRLDGCLTGARIARDRAAASIARFMADPKVEGRA